MREWVRGRVGEWASVCERERESASVSERERGGERCEIERGRVSGFVDG